MATKNYKKLTLIVLTSIIIFSFFGHSAISQINSCIDIGPHSLNTNSCGKWVTVYIELDDPNDTAAIDASTIQLNGMLSPVLDPKCCFVTDEECYLVDKAKACVPGVIERMVKFNRAAVADILPLGEEVGVSITGKLNDGTTTFAGTVVIRVFEGGSNARKGDVNCDGKITVSDVQLILNIFLEVPPPPADWEFWATDCDDNESVNIVDVWIAITKIFEVNWMVSDRKEHSLKKVKENLVCYLIENIFLHACPHT